MAKKTKQYAEGASASLNKSIREIEDFLDGLGLRPPKGKLRNQLHEKIGDLAQKSFERGFRRGCIEMEKKIPRSISYEADRSFFGGKERPIDITWKSKR
jgi:hypothetical protein